MGVVDRPPATRNSREPRCTQRPPPYRRHYRRRRKVSMDSWGNGSVFGVGKNSTDFQVFFGGKDAIKYLVKCESSAVCARKNGKCSPNSKGVE